jgi:VIT1/CCC1 family predicted Fe2+/Mn2+ transporter
MERERHHLEVFTQALDQLEARRTVAVAPPSPATETTAEAVEDTLGRERAEFAPVAANDLDTFVNATIELDRERWRVASLGRIREVVFGAQDGILSTVALVTSVAVALDSQTAVLVAGLAAAAGTISMATGAYLGSRAEQDVQRAEIAREAQEIEEKPAEELAELVVIYQREGRSFEEARRMADEIAEDKELWLRTLVEKELGISPDETSNPMKDAAAMGLSFLLAASVPIIPHILLTGTAAISVSVAGALVALFVLGSLKGRLVQKSPILQGLEILGIGAVSAAIGFALGDGIPRLIS